MVTENSRFLAELKLGDDATASIDIPFDYEGGEEWLGIEEKLGFLPTKVVFGVSYSASEVEDEKWVSMRVRFESKTDRSDNFSLYVPNETPDDVGDSYILASLLVDDDGNTITTLHSLILSDVDEGQLDFPEASLPTIESKKETLLFYFSNRIESDFVDEFQEVEVYEE